MLNQARLKQLKAREEHIRGVLDEAKQKLIAMTQDQNRYQQILEKLIAQGLFQLLEKDVTIKCRQKDVHLVKNSLAKALEEYQAATSKACNVTVDETSFLPAES